MHYPKFQRPLPAWLCVGGEHILEVKERYGPPLSPCQVWWGSDVARRHGAKKFDFCLCYLFVCHAFKWQSLWTLLRHLCVGIQKRSWYCWIGECSQMYTRVQLCLYNAGQSQLQNDKFKKKTIKFGIFRLSRATQWTDRDIIRHVSVNRGWPFWRWSVQRCGYRSPQTFLFWRGYVWLYCI